MRIEDFDKNMAIETNITEPDLVWLDAKESPFVLSGVFYDPERKRYLRLPADVAEQTGPGVAHLNTNTAGGRVRFRTDSSYIAIRMVAKNTTLMNHIPLTGQSGFDLYRDEDGECVYFSTFRPPMGMTAGYSSGVQTDGKMHDYVIHMPLYDCVDELYIALKKNAAVEAPAPYRHPVPVVYYGSSITQGGCASRPGNSYQSILTRRLSVEQINLGFSGCGKAEPAIVDYIAHLNMSVFVCDYDHNAPTPDYLRQTHLPLYRAVRAVHPTLPIIFLTAPDVLLRKGIYLERRQIVKATYDTAVAEGDKNVYFIDGATLFEGECWDSCTVDGCHPNDLGFYRMAMRIEKVLRPLLGE